MTEPAGGSADEAFEAMTYEQLVERLEALVSRMAAGDIGIEEVADLYEEAGRLHAAAADRLERVRQRVEGLVGAPETDGQAAPSDEG